MSDLEHPYHFLQIKNFSANYKKKEKKIDSRTSEQCQSKLKISNPSKEY